MKLPKILLAAGLAALLLPAVASADSIVYIDQGNVWSASPDGARKVQLTTGGSWHSPTQADDGTIAAVQGTGPIVVMARDGRPLRTITTPPAKLRRRRDVRAATRSSSPSRRTGARSPTRTSPTRARSRRPAARSSARPSTRRRRTEATPIDVYGNQFSVSDPEWVTNSRTLVFGGFGSQVSIDDLGPGDYSQKAWMVPNGDMGDGEAHPRRQAARGHRPTTAPNKKLAFFVVTGDVDDRVPARVPRARVRRRPAATSASATRPGRRTASGLAYESQQGHRDHPLHAVRRRPRAPPRTTALLSATGSEPDWGPADAPAAAYVPPTPQTPQTPQTPPGPVATPNPSPAAKFGSVKATAKALKQGPGRQGQRPEPRAR